MHHRNANHELGCHFQLGASTKINPDPQLDFIKQPQYVKLYLMLRTVKRPHKSSAVTQTSELAVIITVGGGEVPQEGCQIVGQ